MLFVKRSGFLIVVWLMVVIYAPSAYSLDNGLAKTPPMGWNSWNKFDCNVSEAKVRDVARGIVDSGMKDAGYTYVVIDDCWQGPRDVDGNITADSQRFPSGIKSLSDYVHSLGLKFGIYSDAGPMTCAKRPGSQGHEYQDARQYAIWGVDYLKYDWCFANTKDGAYAYSIMRDALAASGRPIVFSICEWEQTLLGYGLRPSAIFGGRPAILQIAGRASRSIPTV